MKNRLLRWAFLSTTICLIASRAEADSLTSKRSVEELIQAMQISNTLSQQFALYDAVFRRDPMQPLVDAKGQWIGSAGLNSGLSVQGIIWSEQKPLAIIDDVLYPSGSTVGPYTIEEIQRDGVKVKRGAQELFIPLDRGLQNDPPK